MNPNQTSEQFQQIKRTENQLIQQSLCDDISYTATAEKIQKEQIKQHVDYKELPQNIHKKFENLPAGSYLILRTNKDRTEELHPMLFSLFGMKKYYKGKIKIISVEEFEMYKPLMENLDVSVFKVVKQ